MKILYIINNLGSGGAEKLILDITPIISKNKVDVDVVLLRKKNSIYIEQLQQKGLSVSWLSEENLYSPILFFKLSKLLKKGLYDIVHVHLFPSFYWVALVKLCTSCRAKFIYTEHSTTNRRRKKIVFKFLDRLIYKQYDKIICITEDVKKLLIEYLPHLELKMKVVDNGISLVSYRQTVGLTRSDLIYDYNSSMRLVTMIGRFSAAKDQKTVIQAFKYLPEHIHLLLVGQGPTKIECENLVNELQLMDRIHFLGVRMDVPDILKLSDIGVLSSKWEGFGIAAVESMAAGLPTIGTNVAGLSSVIDEAGLLFEPADYKQLASYIDTLLSDSDFYCLVAKKCKERSFLFDIEKTVSGYINIYKEELYES